MEEVDQTSQHQGAEARVVASSCTQNLRMCWKVLLLALILIQGLLNWHVQLSQTNLGQYLLMYQRNVVQETGETSSLRRRISQVNTEAQPDFTWPPLEDPYFKPQPANCVNCGTSQNASQSSASSDAIPAVMVAISSSVIFCALILYVTDLRDRWRHDRMLEERRTRRENASSKQMDTLASSGGYWVPAPELPISQQLPVLPLSAQYGDLEYVEDISLSPVSTMTGSLAMESGVPRADSDNCIEESIQITELSMAHHVPHDTELQSLVDLSRIQTHTMASYCEKKADDTECLHDTESPRSFQSTLEQDETKKIRISETIYVMSEEEDRSGWASCTGASETSSEVSIGTYLRSVTSAKSRSSEAESHDDSDSTKGSEDHISSSESTKSRASNDNVSGSIEKEPHGINVESELFGEGCICGESMDETPIKANSLQRSPDTPHENGGNGYESRNELAQLELLYDASGFDHEEIVGRKQNVLKQLLEYLAASAPKFNSVTHDEERGEVSQKAEEEFVRDIVSAPLACAPVAPAEFSIELEKDLDVAEDLSVKPTDADILVKDASEKREAAHGESVAVKEAEVNFQNEDENDLHLSTETPESMEGVLKLTAGSLSSDGSFTHSSSAEASVETNLE